MEKIKINLFGEARPIYQMLPAPALPSAPSGAPDEEPVDPHTTAEAAAEEAVEATEALQRSVEEPVADETIDSSSVEDIRKGIEGHKGIIEKLERDLKKAQDIEKKAKKDVDAVVRAARAEGMKVEDIKASPEYRTVQDKYEKAKKAREMVEAKIRARNREILRLERLNRPAPGSNVEAHLQDMTDALEDFKYADTWQKKAECGLRAWVALCSALKMAPHNRVGKTPEAIETRKKRMNLKAEVTGVTDPDLNAAKATDPNVKTKIDVVIKKKSDEVTQKDTDITTAKATLQPLEVAVATAQAAVNASPDDAGKQTELATAKANFEKKKAEVDQEVAKLEKEKIELEKDKSVLTGWKNEVEISKNNMQNYIDTWLEPMAEASGISLDGITIEVEENGIAVRMKVEDPAKTNINAVLHGDAVEAPADVVSGFEDANGYIDETNMETFQEQLHKALKQVLSRGIQVSEFTKRGADDTQAKEVARINTKNNSEIDFIDGAWVVPQIDMADADKGKALAAAHGAATAQDYLREPYVGSLKEVLSDITTPAGKEAAKQLGIDGHLKNADGSANATEAQVEALAALVKDEPRLKEIGDVDKIGW